MVNTYFSQFLVPSIFISASCWVLYILGLSSVIHITLCLYALHQGMFMWVVFLVGFSSFLVWFLMKDCSEMFNTPSAEGDVWPLQSSCWNDPANLPELDLPNPDPKCSQWMPWAPSESFHAGQILYPLGKSCGNYSHNGDSEDQLVSLREAIVKTSLWWLPKLLWVITDQSAAFLLSQKRGTKKSEWLTRKTVEQRKLRHKIYWSTNVTAMVA